MIHHQTLLEMAGANLEASTFGQSVLVLIDFQNEYTEGRLPLEGVSEAMENARMILKVARVRGAPVFHIVHHGRPGAGLFAPGTQAAEIIEALKPLPGEVVMIKHFPNAFAGTDLDALIRETGYKELMIAGLMSHMCVSSTVRAALDLGYRTTVVADACATRVLSVLGQSVDAKTLHHAEMAALGDRFAVIARTADILNAVAT